MSSATTRNGRRIKALISKTPMSVKDIAAAIGLSRQVTGNVINHYLKGKRKRIQIASWVKTKGASIPLYLWGNGEDAPKPKEARQLILEQIADQAMTLVEISAAIGISEQTIGRLIPQLRKDTPIRIAGWIVSRGPHTPQYIIGEGEDEPKPAPLTNAEKIKRYRDTDKGKKTYRRCRLRWRKSAAGREYARKNWQSKYARQQFEKHGAKAIDPLMAIFYR